MRAILLSVFLALALAGLALSLIAHVTAQFGVSPPTGPATWGLHVGIFVVFIPAVIVSRRLVPNPTKEKDWWKEALRGCPRWVGWVSGGFFAYAVVNFFRPMVFGLPPKVPGGGPTPPEVFRTFSGHWMAFYSAAAAILYAALRRDPLADRSLELADRLAGLPGGPQAADYDDCRAAEPGRRPDGGATK
jgi:hypothetical protein